MNNNEQGFIFKLNNEGQLQIKSKIGQNVQFEKETFPSINISGSLSCSITVQKPSMPWQKGDSATISTVGLDARIEENDSGFSLVYDKIGLDEPFSNISLCIKVILSENDLIQFDMEITNNNDEWFIKEVSGPELSGISVIHDEDSIIWPNGLGQRFTKLKEFGKKALNYPSGTASMPWYAISSKEQGIYFGSHDPEMSFRELTLEYNDKDNTMSISTKHFPFCKGGEVWSAPSFVIKPYLGSWHKAADIYRKWYDSVATIMSPPDWAKNSSGWLLAILKQQNGDVMWDYRTGIDQLCDIAQERGLDTIALFGWAHGGHDYLYPDYIPDILMGGTKSIREALQRARNRGLRTIIYANGVIMDTSTSFYRYEGNDAILYTENQEPNVSSIRKFNSATPVTFAKACPGSDTWRKRMLDLAIQANEIGADGILYDQIGVYKPESCYCTSHRHNNPADAYAMERKSMITEIAEYMRKVNPDFIIMTEGIHDTLLSGITYVHGWGCGFSPPQSKHNMFTDDMLFPELFRYTFSDLPMLQRHSTPMLDRYYANYACIYGLRYEIETRYNPDVDYLLNAKIPDLSDYEDVAYYPPDVALMQTNEVEAAKQYLKDIINFSNGYARFLRCGRFMDTLGFTLKGDGIIAKAYQFEEELALFVWNNSSKEEKCEVMVDGMQLVECVEPETSIVDAQAPVPAQSVRVYVFK